MELIGNSWVILGLIGFITVYVRQITNIIFDLIISKITYSYIIPKYSDKYKFLTKYVKKYEKHNHIALDEYNYESLININFFIWYDKYKFVYVVPDIAGDSSKYSVYSFWDIEKLFTNYIERKVKLINSDEQLKMHFPVNNHIVFKHVQSRSLDTIYLPPKFKNNIISIIDRFINSQDYYRKNALPYKLVLSFAGEPGTGKSSLIQAIGSHYSKNLYYLSNKLSSLASNLQGIIINSESNILVIDDFDLIFDELNKTIPNDSRTDCPGYGILLNLLDGKYFAPGAILILTYNDRSKIEKKFLRPGRVDYSFDFPKFDINSAKKFKELDDFDYENFTGSMSEYMQIARDKF